MNNLEEFNPLISHSCNEPTVVSNVYENSWKDFLLESIFCQKRTCYKHLTNGLDDNDLINALNCAEDSFATLSEMRRIFEPYGWTIKFGHYYDCCNKRENDILLLETGKKKLAHNVFKYRDVFYIESKAIVYSKGPHRFTEHDNTHHVIFGFTNTYLQFIKKN